MLTMTTVWGATTHTTWEEVHDGSYVLASCTGDANPSGATDGSTRYCPLLTGYMHHQADRHGMQEEHSKIL